jgi:hypothetical protein
MAGTRLLATSFLLLTLLGAVADAGAGQLVVSWVDNSSGQAGFVVERRAATQTWYTILAEVPPGATSMLDTNVATGTTYCYRVKAHDGVTESEYSNEDCGAVVDAGASVTVTKAGTGAGTVVSSPAGIDCGTSCSATFLSSTLVTLTATAAADSTFAGWSGGGCSGTDPCSFVGNTAVAVTATFTLIPPSPTTLAVERSGPGTVASAPAGIECGTTCAATYPTGTVVTLSATPNKNAVFMGWSGGGCSGTGTTCTVTLREATTVAAAFRQGGIAKRK